MMTKIFNFFQRNGKLLTPIALLGGFLLDNLTLRRSDLLAENILLSIYFVFIFSGLLIWHKIDSKQKKTVKNIEVQSIVFLIIQFIFGGLFSSLTVFYIKSSSFIASWPFLVILFVGMISTEYFKKHFTQFLVQLGTLYVLLFTYSIMIIPIFFKQISPFVFIISGVVSLIIITLYLVLFKKVVSDLFKNKRKYLVGIIGGIFILINTLYFLNVIPPIPLILKESGIYQTVKKESGNYLFSYFKSNFSFIKMKKEYIVPNGSPIYFYSSIYAPVKFQQRIVHEWQRKNSKGDWVVISKIVFPIYGGKDSGYRGYSINDKATKGDWRVLVKTEAGQVLGVEIFGIK